MDNQRLIADGKHMASPGDSHVGLTEDLTESAPSDSETETVAISEEHKPFGWATMHHADLEGVGQLLEHCIHRVSHLEKQRDELIRELLDLREPMQRVVEHLRGKLGDTRRLLTLAQLDYIAVYEDVQQVKRNLFATARDCIQSQVTLAEQEYEVAQSAVTKEELKAHIQNLTQELSELQEVHQNQLSSLKGQASKARRPRAMSDASHCRQASLRLQRRLSGSMKALEGWYEPRLVALLKRRQAGEDALRISREQAADMKARLVPLREDIRSLEVQRSSLEWRAGLMQTEREESIAQYKETVETLKETLRELEVEFEIQRKSKRNLQDLKNGLTEELNFLRDCSEPSETTTERETQPSTSSGSFE